MKKFILPLMSGVIALLAGCSDDTSMFNEPDAIRAYETDARIMAQFVEVDGNTGTYVINPDRKITASDYVISKSREELMEVSQINKDRFLREMEDINSQLSAVRRSGLASAFIYSTQTSNLVIDGDEDDSFRMSGLGEEYDYRSGIASISLVEGEGRSADFLSPAEMVMTINAVNISTFYCVRVSLGDQTEKDAETIFISGIRSVIPSHSYRIESPSITGKNKTIGGMMLIGSGNITVSISR